MIIEFYGLPGSGKSTLAGILSQKTGYPVVKIKNKLELIFYNLIFLLSHPLLFLKTLLFIFFNFKNFCLLYYKVMNQLLDLNARWQKASKYPVAILEQGFWQNIISLPEESLDLHALHRLSRLFLKPDFLISLFSEFEDYNDRLESRGQKPRQHLNGQYLHKWRIIIKHNHQLFKNNLGNFKLNYLMLNARENLNYNADKIINFLHENK